jgi:hypothetical protein
LGFHTFLASLHSTAASQQLTLAQACPACCLSVGLAALSLLLCPTSFVSYSWAPVMPPVWLL